MNRSRILFSPAPADGGGGGGGGAPPADYKFTVPQGFQADAARLTEFTDFAKKSKLPQDIAQGVFERELNREKAAADKSKPPDKYNLKPPQGVTVEQADLDSLEADIKALGLSQDQAEKLFARELRLDTERVEQQKVFLQEQKKHWDGLMLKDPVYGGDKLTATADRSRRAVTEFAPPQIPGQPSFQEMLEQSTLGSHPYFVQFTANIGAAMAEGNIANKSDAEGEGGKLSPDERLRRYYEAQEAGAKK